MIQASKGCDVSEVMLISHKSCSSFPCWQQLWRTWSQARICATASLLALKVCAQQKLTVQPFSSLLLFFVCLVACYLLTFRKHWMSSGYIHGVFLLLASMSTLKIKWRHRLFPSIIRKETKHETNACIILMKKKTETQIMISETGPLSLISCFGLFLYCLFQGKYVPRIWEPLLSHTSPGCSWLL